MANLSLSAKLSLSHLAVDPLVKDDLSEHGKVDENCCKRIRVEMFTNISLVASYAGIYETNFSETTFNEGRHSMQRSKSSLYDLNLHIWCRPHDNFFRRVLLSYIQVGIVKQPMLTKPNRKKFVFLLLLFVLPFAILNSTRDCIKYAEYMFVGFYPVYRNQENSSLYFSHIKIWLICAFVQLFYFINYSDDQRRVWNISFFLTFLAAS